MKDVFCSSLVDFGTKFAFNTEKARKEAFSAGTKTFSLLLKRIMDNDTASQPIGSHKNMQFIAISPLPKSFQKKSQKEVPDSQLTKNSADHYNPENPFRLFS